MCNGVRERCSRKNPIHRRRNEKSERGQSIESESKRESERERHTQAIKRRRRRSRKNRRGQVEKEASEEAIWIRRRRQVGEKGLMKKFSNGDEVGAAVGLF